jgi:hypothetical protein
MSRELVASLSDSSRSSTFCSFVEYSGGKNGTSMEARRTAHMNIPTLSQRVFTPRNASAKAASVVDAVIVNGRFVFLDNLEASSKCQFVSSNEVRQE